MSWLREGAVKVVIHSSDKRPAQVIFQGEQIVLELPDACLDSLLKSLGEALGSELVKEVLSSEDIKNLKIKIESGAKKEEEKKGSEEENEIDTSAIEDLI